MDRTRALGTPLHRWLAAGAVLAGLGLAAATLLPHAPDPRLEIALDRTAIPAGGAAVHLTLRSTIPLPASGLKAVISASPHSARIDQTYFEGDAWHVTVRSKGLPGKVVVTATLPPFSPSTVELQVLPGGSDVLHLDDPGDEQAFRSWLAFLAEAQFFKDTATLAPDIADCAGLIRYCYREALRAHDGAWAKTAALPLVPAIPSIRKYEYPYTPWGAALFRAGPQPADIAEFADAATLLRFNTHFVSRDIRQARRGDLIFFYREDAAMPYHSMVFLGPSQIENDPGPFLVYHTGPRHDPESKGEIRRPSVGELQKHPDAAWHPVLENTHYLGVYRWNILN